MAAVCGDSTAFSRLRRGLSAGNGYAAKTSRPAQAMVSFFSASIKSGSLITEPRDVLINSAVGFIIMS